MRRDGAVIGAFFLLLVAQRRFRRLNAPELLKEIYHGATFVNGVRVMERAWGVAA